MSQSGGVRVKDVDDKVCEQVSMTMLSQVYPKEALERCVQASQPWTSKVRPALCLPHLLS